MAHMDVFNDNAFSMAELTARVDKEDHLPQLLGSMGLFEPVPIRTTVATIEQRDTTLSLIQTSPRGAPLEEQTDNKRKLLYVETPRIAKGDTLYASEIQSIRAFGSETELMQAAREIGRRNMRLRRDAELTWENMRLGAVKGIVLDADGSALVNWFTIMNVSQDSEIDFDLDNASPASGAVRRKCAQVVRQMTVGGKGAMLATTRVVGLAGDNFFDDLTAHSEVRQTFLNTQEAMRLREGYAWTTFTYGGIQWINYRGTDDGTTVGVGTDKAIFFPLGAAPETFQHIKAPAETFDFVNTPGQDFYAMLVRDLQRNMWVRPEVYSYPLFVCTRPKMLQRAKRT